VQLPLPLPLQVIFSNLWGLMLFGEQLALLSSLGALLIAAGVTLATLASHEAQRKPALDAAPVGGGCGGDSPAATAAAEPAGVMVQIAELLANASSGSRTAANGRGASRSGAV
jgi:hypothetical protein